MKSINCINEISVSYTKKQFTSTTIKTSAQAYEVAKEMYSAGKCQMELKEYFYIMLLNRANQVIGYHRLSEGGICGTVVDIRIALATALKSLATGMILVHNHPSGNLNPSKEDISLTKKFKQAGELVDITLYDHLILTSTSYHSMTDEGTSW